MMLHTTRRGALLLGLALVNLTLGECFLSPSAATGRWVRSSPVLKSEDEGGALNERADVVRAMDILMGRGGGGGGGGGRGSWDVELCSPSKINLFLRIVRRRDDGYHDLASLFQAISLSDKLCMSLLPADAEDDEFECDMEGVPVDRTNLVLRAVDVFRENSGVERKFKIRLEKTVPAQAGLGGGSGNAATALWACNEVCAAAEDVEGFVAKTNDELLAMSTTLGSDATFFLSEGTAYCTGRGEVVTKLPPMLPAVREQPLYIVKPFVGLSTPEVFKALDLDSRSTKDPLNLLGLHTMNADGDEKYVNDLQPPAFSCLPDLARLKDVLESTDADAGGVGFPVVSMSGSGTSIFCLGEPSTGEDQDSWAARLSEEGRFPWPIKVFKASFLNRKEGSWYEV